MKNTVMYISRRFETNICATVHLQAMKKLYKDKLIVIDLRTEGNFSDQNNLLKMGAMTYQEKIFRTLQLNTWYLTEKRIKLICDKICNCGVCKVFIDESCFGKLVKRIKEQFPKVKVITFYHDIGRVLYPQWLKNRGAKYLPDFLGSIYGEYLNQRYADGNYVLNHRDEREFMKAYHKNPSGLLPMAVADPDFETVEAKEFDFKKKDDVLYILFVGSKYYPNIVGLRWFVDNVFLNLEKKYKLLVIGRGMEEFREEYSHIANICIIGGVEKLAPYYNNADIVVAPIFEGGGMKQKTAEALAYGKVFIGTSESMYGYEEACDIRSDGKQVVFSCDDKDGQISAIKQIEKTGIAGKRFEELTTLFENKYSEKAICRSLTEIFDV